jgi:hypothetical protein
VHPNKHIQAAVEYAVAHGWRLHAAGGHAHVWGYLLCPGGHRGDCRVPVYSTPRVPENHARFIRHKVDVCPH